MADKIFKNYKLKKDITYSQLEKNGFHNGRMKIDLYKGLIFLLITVELKTEADSENWWTYQVCNKDCTSLYTSYYDREYGINKIVPKLDKKIDTIFSKKLSKVFQRTKNVRWNYKNKKRSNENEKNCKVSQSK